MRLPQALEKMLEFKNLRAHEVGVDPDNLEKREGEALRNKKMLLLVLAREFHNCVIF